MTALLKYNAMLDKTEELRPTKRQISRPINPEEIKNWQLTFDFLNEKCPSDVANLILLFTAAYADDFDIRTERPACFVCKKEPRSATLFQFHLPCVAREYKLYCTRCLQVIYLDFSDFVRRSGRKSLRADEIYLQNFAVCSYPLVPGEFNGCFIEPRRVLWPSREGIRALEEEDHVVPSSTKFTSITIDDKKNIFYVFDFRNADFRRLFSIQQFCNIMHRKKQVLLVGDMTDYVRIVTDMQWANQYFYRY